MNVLTTWWKYRNTPHADLIEQHELICKAARRCMYDLKHCLEEISDSGRYALYLDRFKTWEVIFEAATGAKDYRHELHRVRAAQQREIEKLTKILADNGILLPEDPPF